MPQPPLLPYRTSFSNWVFSETREYGCVTTTTFYDFLGKSYNPCEEKSILSHLSNIRYVPGLC